MNNALLDLTNSQTEPSFEVQASMDIGQFVLYIFIIAIIVTIGIFIYKKFNK